MPLIRYIKAFVLRTNLSRDGQIEIDYAVYEDNDVQVSQSRGGPIGCCRDGSKVLHGRNELGTPHYANYPHEIPTMEQPGQA